MTQNIPIDQIKGTEFAPGEEDEYLIELITKQVEGKIQAESTMIDMKDIEPFCQSLRPTLRQDAIDSIKSEIKNGNPPSMLVYYKNDKFIMSDDYYTYYAHKELGSQKVPCQVLGGTK